ncbi:MAG: HD domain-containing protein [bacterium]|nr:HD domain-containing protein [bacterium]
METKQLILNNLNITIQTENKNLLENIENILKKPEILQLISKINQTIEKNNNIQNLENIKNNISVNKIILKELSNKTIIKDNTFILSDSIFSSNLTQTIVGIIEKEELQSEFFKNLISQDTLFDFIICYTKEDINSLYYQIFSFFYNLSFSLRNNQQQYIEKLIKDIINLKIENEELLDEIIYRLSLAAEYKDEYTGTHIKRISMYCNLIAKELKLDKDFIKKITLASPLHDVGKIGIPDNILLKPGKLTKEEFEIMKTHTLIGAKILDNSKQDLIKFAKEIALYHHEKYNGNGYPYNLKGEEIPLSARIVAIADVFDALTSKRPYKDPYPIPDTINIIKQEANQHFDPEITNIFLKNIKEIVEIRYLLA